MAGFDQGHLDASLDSLKSCGRTNGPTANDANTQTLRELAKWGVRPATGLGPLESPILEGRDVCLQTHLDGGFRRKEGVVT